MARGFFGISAYRRDLLGQLHSMVQLDGPLLDGTRHVYIGDLLAQVDLLVDDADEAVFHG